MNEWLATNWDTIVMIAGALYVVAKVVVNLTPSEEDNLILPKIVSWIERLVDLFIPNLTKDKKAHNFNLFVGKKRK